MRETIAVGYVLVVAFACLAGCTEHPRFPRLAEGSRVILFDDKEEKVFGMTKSTGKAGSEYLFMPIGTHCIVMKDDGPDKDEGRRVKVFVTEGENKDVAAMVNRKNMREDPR
jgi:hypothetical protein